MEIDNSTGTDEEDDEEEEEDDDDEEEDDDDEEDDGKLLVILLSLIDAVMRKNCDEECLFVLKKASQRANGGREGDLGASCGGITAPGGVRKNVSCGACERNRQILHKGNQCRSTQSLSWQWGLDGWVGASTVTSVTGRECREPPSTVFVTSFS